MLGVVEGAADVGHVGPSGGSPTRAGSDDGIVALVSTAVRWSHTPSRSAGPTSSGAISRRGRSGSPDTKST